MVLAALARKRPMEAWFCLKQMTGQKSLEPWLEQTREPLLVLSDATIDDGACVLCYWDTVHLLFLRALLLFIQQQPLILFYPIIFKGEISAFRAKPHGSIRFKIIGR